MKEEEIIERIHTLYPDAVIEVAGADCSFEMYVISTAFAGQSLLQRQKSILGLFKDDLQNGALHALSVTAKTPDERSAQSGLVQLKMPS